MKPTLLSISRRILQKKIKYEKKKRHGYCAFIISEIYTCISSSEEIIASKDEIHLDKFKISVDDE